MVEKSNNFIQIDLNQFKLHISLPHTPALTLHFNSPSRRFYLSVIALVVHEMKRIGRITSIPLDEHVELLGLLNETIGDSAGSSESEHLLPRIYRKWKDSLSDLENAPLFKVLGKKRNSKEGLGAAYPFTDEEKDAWANLFEYRGSEEHVRLRFSFDKLGAGLDDVAISYGKDPELADDAAWDRFIADLRQEAAKQRRHVQIVPEERESVIPPSTKGKIALSHRWKWAALAVGIAVVAVFTIRHFYFRPPPIEPASVDRMAFPLPDKPSIAVLPFVNMSEDPKQEYFGDGITEEIITALSKVPYLFVIARNSTFSYKGKPVKISRMAEELGVRYVLEGSFRRVGDRVRVTAQLIDAIKGHHLWAERYERKLKDIFALQDEITVKILWALEVKLTKGEQASTRRKVTDNLDAYLKTLKAMEGLYRGDRKGNLLARQRAEEAVALDRKYARPYRVLACSHVMDVVFGTSKSPKNSLERADKLIQKAISLDETDPCGYEVLSFIYLMKGQHDRTIAEAKRAIALDPNGADAYRRLGMALIYAGRPEEAIAPLEKAIRINPIAPDGYFFLNLGRAYRDTGRYEEAIGELRKAINRAPDSSISHFELVATYSLAGRVEEARAEVEELLKINPRASVKDVKRIPYKNPADRERIANAMRKAGLTETPPLPLPDKPSIAILPFINLSGDPSQEYLSDGITEQIITCLSKVPKLFVIAHNSTLTYKGKPQKVQTVGRELGVRYVMEGSVHRWGDRIRVTAQLIDATTGHHLWAERYDRQLKDLFALQDEITMKIITALEVKLTEGEQALVTGSGTNDLDAYLKILEARDLKRHQTIEANHKARRLAREAIELDPDYAQAYRWLSGTHLVDVWLGSTKSPRESLKKAAELAKKALSLDDSLGGAHGLLGNIYVMMRDYENGIRETKRAVELEPNGADAHSFLGLALKFADRAEEAIPIIQKAIRLDPHSPGWYLYNLAGAYRNVEKYEEAAYWAERAVQQNPQNVLSRVILCSIYSLSGQMDKARAQAEEIMKIDPNISVERWLRTHPQKNQALKEQCGNALRRAGLK